MERPSDKFWRGFPSGRICSSGSLKDVRAEGPSSLAPGPEPCGSLSTGIIRVLSGDNHVEVDCGRTLWAGGVAVQERDPLEGAHAEHRSARNARAEGRVRHVARAIRGEELAAGFHEVAA